MEPFFKFHALGNDFVVVDRRATGVDFEAERVRWLCDRHHGIGADGVLAILPAPGAVARMVVHNADGSVAEMCGNGIRCVARYLAERDPARPSHLLLDTGAGQKDCALEWDGARVARVTVDMGPAAFRAPHLPRAPDGGDFLEREVGGVVGTAVSMGNPHLVLFSTPAARAAELGPRLERDPAFPQRTNVEFAAPRQGGGLAVVVWERGVGLTQACGTGACATVAAAARLGRAPYDAWVPVELPGGVLEVKVAQDGAKVWMRGPATPVFEGGLPP